MQRKAIFWDRDGVISKPVARDDSYYSPRTFDEFALMDGILPMLETSQEVGFLNIVVTNQPDIARGLMAEQELEKMHHLIKERLPVDDIIVCPHDDRDECQCRKPKPGMLLEAARRWNINLSASFLVGDHGRDIEAGRQAGCITVLLESSYNKGVESDFRVRALSDMIDIIYAQKA